MQPMQNFITKLVWIALVFLMVENLCCAQAPADLYRRLEDSLVSKNGKFTSPDFSWITPQIRAELIQYAYTTKSEDFPKPKFIKPQDALFMLGDPATVQQAVNAYRKAGGGQNIGGPPEVILPYLIDDLTHASSENHFDNPDKVSLMDTSLLCTLNVINTWSYFPKATRDWIESIAGKPGIYYKFGPDGNLNRMLREWWIHNKDAIMARQYDKATWLPPKEEEVPDSPVWLRYQKRLADIAATNGINPSPPEIVHTPPTSAQSAHVVATVPADNAGGIWWPIGIALVIVTSGFFLVRFALAKKP